MERTRQGEVGTRKARIWTGAPCDPSLCPPTEFPPDRLQLADGDHYRSGPPLHWVHREGGDWVLEAGDFGTPLSLGGAKEDTLNPSILRHFLGALFRLG